MCSSRNFWPLDTTACAAFSKESRTKFASANKLYRKSGDGRQQRAMRNHRCLTPGREIDFWGKS